MEGHPSHLSSGPTQFEADGTDRRWLGVERDRHTKVAVGHLGDFRFCLKRSTSQECFEPNPFNSGQCKSEIDRYRSGSSCELLRAGKVWKVGRRDQGRED